MTETTFYFPCQHVRQHVTRWEQRHFPFRVTCLAEAEILREGSSGRWRFSPCRSDSSSTRWEGGECGDVSHPAGAIAEGPGCRLESVVVLLTLLEQAVQCGKDLVAGASCWCCPRKPRMLCGTVPRGPAEPSAPSDTGLTGAHALPKRRTTL